MVVDAHAHVFPEFAGIFNGLPLVSGQCGKVRNGNHTFQFLPPSFEDSASRWEVLLAYMDTSGVDKAVLMPNALYGYHNDYLMDAVKKKPDRFKAIALADVTKGKAAIEELRALHKTGLLAGMKIEVNSAFQCRRDLNITSPELDELWEYMDSESQLVFLHPYHPEDIERIRVLVGRCKKIRFVLCHAGAEAALSGYKSGTFALDALLETAKNNENMWFDTSGIFCTMGDQYPFELSNEIIRRVYNVVGARRLLWGSDYPGTLSIATYMQMMDQISRHCGFFHENDIEEVMGYTAERLIWG